MTSATLAQNLLPDPSFEKPMDRNRWGHVFSDWGGNVYEGNPRFEVGQVARLPRPGRLRPASSWEHHLDACPKMLESRMLVAPQRPGGVIFGMPQPLVFLAC